MQSTGRTEDHERDAASAREAEGGDAGASEVVTITLIARVHDDGEATYMMKRTGGTNDDVLRVLHGAIARHAEDVFDTA
jgi:hypothetical protein